MPSPTSPKCSSPQADPKMRSQPGARPSTATNAKASSRSPAASGNGWTQSKRSTSNALRAEPETEVTIAAAEPKRRAQRLDLLLLERAKRRLEYSDELVWR